MNSPSDKTKNESSQTTSTPTTKKTQMFIFTPEKLQQLGIGNIIQEITAKSSPSTSKITSVDISKNSDIGKKIISKDSERKTLDTVIDTPQNSLTKELPNLIQCSTQNISTIPFSTSENVTAGIDNKIVSIDNEEKISDTVLSESQIKIESYLADVINNDNKIKTDQIIPISFKNLRNPNLERSELISLKKEITDPLNAENSKDIRNENLGQSSKMGSIKIISNTLLQSSQKEGNTPDTKNIITSNLSKILLAVPKPENKPILQSFKDKITQKIIQIPESTSQKSPENLPKLNIPDNLGCSMKNKLSQILSPDKLKVKKLSFEKSKEMAAPSTSKLQNETLQSKDVSRLSEKKVHFKISKPKIRQAVKKSSKKLIQDTDTIVKTECDLEIIKHGLETQDVFENRGCSIETRKLNEATKDSDVVREDSFVKQDLGNLEVETKERVLEIVEHGLEEGKFYPETQECDLGMQERDLKTRECGVVATECDEAKEKEAVYSAEPLTIWKKKMKSQFLKSVTTEEEIRLTSKVSDVDKMEIAVEKEEISSQIEDIPSTIQSSETATITEEETGLGRRKKDLSDLQDSADKEIASTVESVNTNEDKVDLLSTRELKTTEKEDTRFTSQDDTNEEAPTILKSTDPKPHKEAMSSTCDSNKITAKEDTGVTSLKEYTHYKKEQIANEIPSILKSRNPKAHKEDMTYTPDSNKITEKEDTGINSPKEGTRFSSPKEYTGLNSAKKDTGLCSPKEDTGLISPKEDNRLSSPKEDTGLSSLKDDIGLISPKEDTGFINPEEDNKLSSPNEDIGLISPKEDTGFICPKADTVHISPKEDTGLISPKEDAGLSTPKEDTELSSQKDNIGLISPKEDTGLISPKEDSGLSTPKEDTELSSPKEDTELNNPKEDTSGTIEEISEKEISSILKSADSKKGKETIPSTCESAAITKKEEIRFNKLNENINKEKIKDIAENVSSTVDSEEPVEDIENISSNSKSVTVIKKEDTGLRIKEDKVVEKTKITIGKEDKPLTSFTSTTLGKEEICAIKEDTSTQKTQETVDKKEIHSTFDNLSSAESITTEKEETGLNLRDNTVAKNIIIIEKDIYSTVKAVDPQEIVFKHVTMTEKEDTKPSSKEDIAEEAMKMSVETEEMSSTAESVHHPYVGSIAPTTIIKKEIGVKTVEEDINLAKKESNLAKKKDTSTKKDTKLADEKYINLTKKEETVERLQKPIKQNEQVRIDSSISSKSSDLKQIPNVTSNLESKIQEPKPQISAEIEILSKDIKKPAIQEKLSPKFVMLKSSESFNLGLSSKGRLSSLSSKDLSFKIPKLKYKETVSLQKKDTSQYDILEQQMEELHKESGENEIKNKGEEIKLVKIEHVEKQTLDAKETFKMDKTSNENLEDILTRDKRNTKSQKRNESPTFSPSITPTRKSGRARKSKSLGSDFITDDSFIIREEIEEPTETPPEKKKRGRPKKIKPPPEEVEVNMNISQEEIKATKEVILNKIKKEVIDIPLDYSVFEENVPTVSIPKKRGRPRKVRNSDEEQVSKKPHLEIPELEVEESLNRPADVDDEFKNIEDPTPPKKRGRKRRHEPFVNISPSGLVVCATCNDEMTKTRWNWHNQRSHNNLSWRVGEEPLDLSNEKVVTTILLQLIKAKKLLKCEHCGITKRSAAGFISHKAICQKSEEEIMAMRVNCEICGKSYHPSSLGSHMYQAHTEKPLKELKSAEKPVEKSPTTGGRAKRRAAEKAINLLQNVTIEEEEIQKENDVIVVPRILYRTPDNPNKSVLCASLIKQYNRDIKLDKIICCKFKNCEYACSDVEEMKRHLFVCPIREDDDFTCRICLHVTKDENSITEHVAKNHLKVYKEKEKKEDDAVEESSDDELEDEVEIPNIVDGEIKPRRAFYARTKCTVGFLNKERSCPATQFVLFPAAYKWTLEFCAEHYQDLLFKDNLHKKSDWIPIPKEDIDEYLPKERLSMHCESVLNASSVLNVQRTERNWNRFNLFEAEVTKDSATLYCGGPIFAMSWIPTPVQGIYNQYLAVSALKNHGQNFRVSQSYSSTEMLQFWNFGPITNNEKPLKTTPKLAFGLVHEHGNIWAMDWCPSGCFNEDYRAKIGSEGTLSRLGMVALACSDGNIPIYTISIAENSDTSEIRLYKTKPTYKLIQCERVEQELGNWTYQATKVVWTKVKGHSIVVGGYSNGVVAAWNLTSKSPLLWKEKDGVTILKPYLIFQAHEGPITALCLNTNEGGKKWLFTGSTDRSSKYWDLENIRFPQTVHSKSVVTDGWWINHWVATFCAYDDIYSYAHTVSTLQSIRDYSFPQFPVAPTNSLTTSITGCDWGNQVAQGSYAGELVAVFPHQLLVSCESDKTMRNKRTMLSYTELVEKNVPPEDREKKIMAKQGYLDSLSKDLGDKDDAALVKMLMNKKTIPFESEEETYEAASKRYGLVFHHFKMDINKPIPEVQKTMKQSVNMRKPFVEMYPLQSVNRVAWNQNKQAFLYIASGYNAGFVRIQNVRFLNINPHIR